MLVLWRARHKHRDSHLSNVRNSHTQRNHLVIQAVLLVPSDSSPITVSVHLNAFHFSSPVSRPSTSTPPFAALTNSPYLIFPSNCSLTPSLFSQSPLSTASSCLINLSLQIALYTRFHSTNQSAFSLRANHTHE